MEIDRSLDPNPKVGRAPSVLIHGIPPTSRKGATTICRLPQSAPNVERGGTPGGDSGARQGALVGDSLNDEQRCDHLTDPQSY